MGSPSVSPSAGTSPAHAAHDGGDWVALLSSPGPGTPRRWPACTSS